MDFSVVGVIKQVWALYRLSEVPGAIMVELQKMAKEDGSAGILKGSHVNLGYAEYILGK